LYADGKTTHRSDKVADALATGEFAHVEDGVAVA